MAAIEPNSRKPN